MGLFTWREEDPSTRKILEGETAFRVGLLAGAPENKFWEKDLKAATKHSEAILSILGDCCEKFVCSSLPAKLMEEFPASKVHLQPGLLGSFPSQQTYVHIWYLTGQFGCDHRAKFSPSVVVAGGGGGGGGGGFKKKGIVQKTQTSNSKN